MVLGVGENLHSEEVSVSLGYTLWHAGLLTSAPKFTTCNQIHALHGSISVFLLEALLLIIKRRFKWQ